jgi:hypothetical protein
MKHGYREDSVFPKPVGNLVQINANNQKILEEIIKLIDIKKVPLRKS